MKTIIDWKTGLPKYSGTYIVLTEYELTTYSYSAKHKAWNAFDHFSEAEAKKYDLTPAVICWTDPINIEEAKRRLEDENENQF